jgi:hypothetical protein
MRSREQRICFFDLSAHLKVSPSVPVILSVYLLHTYIFSTPELKTVPLTFSSKESI